MNNIVPPTLPGVYFSLCAFHNAIRSGPVLSIVIRLAGFRECCYFLWQDVYDQHGTLKPHK